jgi:hypothetical protein
MQPYLAGRHQDVWKVAVSFAWAALSVSTSRNKTAAKPFVFHLIKYISPRLVAAPSAYNWDFKNRCLYSIN